MGPEQQIDLPAHGLAHGGDETLAAREHGSGGLARVEDRVAADRVELHRRESARGVLGGARGGALRVDVQVRALALGRVEIGVAAQALVYPPAEERVHGPVEGLAHDVPAGHLDPAQHTAQGSVRT